MLLYASNVEFVDWLRRIFFFKSKHKTDAWTRKVFYPNPLASVNELNFNILLWILRSVLDLNLRVSKLLQLADGNA